LHATQPVLEQFVKRGKLDNAVERVDRAVASLTGRHPDYWHLLTELDAVKETVQQVVEQIRQERAAGH